MSLTWFIMSSQFTIWYDHRISLKAGCLHLSFFHCDPPVAFPRASSCLGLELWVCNEGKVLIVRYNIQRPGSLMLKVENLRPLFLGSSARERRRARSKPGAPASTYVARQPWSDNHHHYDHHCHHHRYHHHNGKYTCCSPTLQSSPSSKLQCF